jgi:molybdate transport system substrate-binding protein
MGRILALPLLLLPLLLVACGSDRSGGDTAGQGGETTLLVSAAADLGAVMKELATAFAQDTGIHIQVNYDSTARLASQIEHGAPVDVFLAANRPYVETLARKGLVLPDTVRVYAYGRLVLWTRQDSPLTIGALSDLLQPQIRRISMANPEHAPYGVATRQALERLGIWEGLQPKLVIAGNVQEAFLYARSGNADAALTALALVIDQPGRWTLVPPELHDPLEQTLAIVKTTRNLAAARQLVDFLTGPDAAPIWRRYGFGLPGEVER